MDLLSIAESAALSAAAWLRAVPVPRHPGDWTVKGRNDFVTDVDRHAEALLAGALLDGAPGSRLVGEESGPDLVEAGVVWIVDPLDGTTNFLHGYPACAVSIAAAVDGVLEAGVVVRLAPERTFTARRGSGAWLDGRPLSVSAIDTPAHALIGTGFPFKHPELLPAYLAQFARVTPATSGIRRAGSAALDLAILLLPPGATTGGTGASFGWTSGGTLARVPLAGGVPREILEETVDADWAPDGQSLAVTHWAEGSCRLEFPVGKPLYQSSNALPSLRVSPDGERVAFLEALASHGSLTWSFRVGVVDRSGSQKELARAGWPSGLAWSSSGHEVWFGRPGEQGEERRRHSTHLR